MDLPHGLRLLGVILSSSIAIGCQVVAPQDGPVDAARCTASAPYDWEGGHNADIPRSVYVEANGTGTFSLDERLASGWRVSVIDGDLPAPSVLEDGGALSGFAPGDRIEVTARAQCQPFSGCKSFAVVRDARDHALITARFNDDASKLADFATALGLPLTLEPVCSASIQPICYEHEVETRYSLRVGADQSVEVARHSHAPLVVDGRKYMAWLGSASTIAGDQRLSGSAGCLDQTAFWADGGIEFTIVR